MDDPDAPAAWYYSGAEESRFNGSMASGTDRRDGGDNGSQEMGHDGTEGMMVTLGVGGRGKSGFVLSWFGLVGVSHRARLWIQLV